MLICIMENKTNCLYHSVKRFFFFAKSQEINHICPNQFLKMPCIRQPTEKLWRIYCKSSGMAPTISPTIYSQDEYASTQYIQAKLEVTRAQQLTCQRGTASIFLMFNSLTLGLKSYFLLYNQHYGNMNINFGRQDSLYLQKL